MRKLNNQFYHIKIGFTSFFLQKNKNKLLKFKNFLSLKTGEDLRTPRLKSKFTGSYRENRVYVNFQNKEV